MQKQLSFLKSDMKGDSSSQKTPPKIGGVLVKLMQGFLFREQKEYWQELVIQSEYVREYFFVQLSIFLQVLYLNFLFHL